MRWLFASFFSLLLLASCGKPGPSSGLSEKELVVLTRSGPTTYSVEEGSSEPTGFEHDLVKAFADSIGRKARFVVVASDSEIIEGLHQGRGHVGAAWLTAIDDQEIVAGPSYFSSGNVIAQNDTALTVDEPRELEGREVRVIAGSRQAAALRELQQTVPGITIVEETQGTELDLIARVADHRAETALVDSALLDIASNFYPQVVPATDVGKESRIVWLFPASGEARLREQAAGFIAQAQADGTLARLKDRYFGHVERLKQADLVKFIERLRVALPQYRAMFQAAQASTSIDWRLLAALAYQESQWDPLATSPTGVRGMMMLTEDTADHLRVSNRLDPRQSIRAGSQYFSDLRDTLPDSVPEPDRTWMAIAAYNLGMGHLNGARQIAQGMKKDADSWYEMKTVLPLLARPEVYRRLKSGRARGGEAVITAENVRVYYDILSRFEAPYRPFAEGSMAGGMMGMSGMSGMSGTSGLGIRR